MTERKTGQMHPDGIIGITDDGLPIVTDRNTCPYWEPGENRLLTTRECWYCRFADFRKTTVITLQKSICRNPRCRVAGEKEIPRKAKNEELRSEGE